MRGKVATPTNNLVDSFRATRKKMLNEQSVVTVIETSIPLPTVIVPPFAVRREIYLNCVSSKTMFTALSTLKYYKSMAHKDESD